ncbi:YdeI/OmpD-associated family protein [soil metagenome]
MEVVYFESAAAFRIWLEANHESATELWVAYYRKGTGRSGITYAEAVDQALCFGWIDGVAKRVDEVSYANRYTPRRRGSIWSALNIARVGELMQQGLMHPSGVRAFEARQEARSGVYAYEQATATLDATQEQFFRANQPAWEFWQRQPQSYRKKASWWVISAKREETRTKRLATLVRDSAQGRRIAQLIRPSKARTGPPDRKPEEA